MPRDEELTIRLLLMSTNDLQIKLGLIRLCEAYQRGQQLNQQHDIRARLRSFIFEEKKPEIARWALKILAEMRNPDDYHILLARLKAPPDNQQYFAENHAWTVVAFHAVANSTQVIEAYESGVLNKDAISLIAHELAEVPGLIPGDFPRVNIQKADPVLLKCACVCMATSRNNRNIYDPKFKQTEQLVALNSHDVAEVAQYSIYAMWRMPQIKFGQLGFAPHTLLSRPKDVRRWTYRLLTKQQKEFFRNRDFFEDILVREIDATALEGLALGTRDVWYDGIEIPVIDCFNSAQDDRVKNAILEHMARQSDHCSSYPELVVETYRNNASQVLKARIKEAAATTALYGKLEQLDDAANRQPNFIFEGELHVTKITQNFSGGHNVIGVNTLGGDSKDNNVKQSIKLTPKTVELIDKIQSFAKQKSQSKEADTVVTSLQELKKEPTTSKLQNALESIRKWSGATTIAVEIAALAKDFADATKELI